MENPTKEQKVTVEMDEPKVEKAEMISAKGDDINKNELKIRILPIGVGQGGTRVAQAIAAKLEDEDNIVLVNTALSDVSTKDVKYIEAHLAKLGALHDVEGSGKNRDYAISTLKDGIGAVLKFVADRIRMNWKDAPRIKEDTDMSTVQVSPAQDVGTNLIVVCFSTAGGTGSGCGPKLVSILDSDMFWSDHVKVDFSTDKTRKPVVIGLAITPDHATEGIVSLQNTIACLDDMNVQINKGFARYFAVNNHVHWANTAQDGGDQ